MKLKDEKEIQTMIDKLHTALIVVAEYDVDLLSYEGQTLWNVLAKQKGGLKNEPAS